MFAVKRRQEEVTGEVAEELEIDSGIRDRFHLR